MLWTLAVVPFTRIENKNPDEKLVIDYAIASNDLVPFLKSMAIDESKKINKIIKLEEIKTCKVFY